MSDALEMLKKKHERLTRTGQHSALPVNRLSQPDEAHMFEPHDDRHVWLHRENANGISAPFNPKVSCDHHTGATHFPAAAGESH